MVCTRARTRNPRWGSSSTVGTPVLPVAPVIRNSSVVSLMFRAFLGDSAAGWTQARVMAVRKLTTGICVVVFDATTVRPFPVLGSTDRAVRAQGWASDEQY